MALSTTPPPPHTVSAAAKPRPYPLLAVSRGLSTGARRSLSSTVSKRTGSTSVRMRGDSSAQSTTGTGGTGRSS
ncbi:hypothetical protein B0H12DRAFT_1125198 [Mycena haematopus]|nr:hypothetical protein B0H12DRAFT_1125198 [Mycena haematopus]